MKIQYPRLSYLPFLLPRLHDFFISVLINPDVSPHTGWFSVDGVPLKWQHPLGLLYDLFSGATPSQVSTSLISPPPLTASDTLPWKLTLHFTSYPSSLIPLCSFTITHTPASTTVATIAATPNATPNDTLHDNKTLHDAYINDVKEADHLRNGTAKSIMSLPVSAGENLWRSVRAHDLKLFNSVNEKLLNPASGVRLRHVPLKVYLPTSAASHSTSTIPPAADASISAPRESQSSNGQPRGTLKVVQTLITPLINGREVQTLGTALHAMLPGVFPSRRSCIHAYAVLHGAVVPLEAPVEDLMKGAAFCDGWLHLGVVMCG